mmetsp:Transcript_87023/g.182151  ORF Transcript_87023/g.182151 Transcript_87023/m.182151 type:complete len:85 (-) Transcript_87023:32-286(-)
MWAGVEGAHLEKERKVPPETGALCMPIPAQNVPVTDVIQCSSSPPPLTDPPPPPRISAATTTRLLLLLLRDIVACELVACDGPR